LPCVPSRVFVCCETREMLKGNNYERWHYFVRRNARR
jgi:hypothetical protein